MNSKSKFGEFELISKITKDRSYFRSKGIVGPGDDCAVIEGNYLITTDTLLEDRHFKTSYSSFYDIGWKAIAVSISDIAAMAGYPIAATVAIQIPSSLSLDDVREIYRGIYDLADRFDLPIVGGDTVQSDKIGINTTIIGKPFTKPAHRFEAKPGDDLWVSNQIGLAQLGLESFVENSFNQYKINHQRPEPQIEIAKDISNYVNAMIDVSDGLFQDLMHLCNASSVAVELQLEQVPTALIYVENPEKFLKLCTSGDDYQLLFSASQEYRNQLSLDSRLTRIGSFIDGHPSILVNSIRLEELLKNYGIRNLGYQHF